MQHLKVYAVPKIGSLQLLRGLAVILVIVAHAVDYAAGFGRGQITSFYFFENFGAIGVDIFFVISGVIITVITNGSQISPKRFFIKRCIRIVPLYWGASLFCVLLSLSGHWQAISNAAILQTLTLIPLFKSGYISGPVLFLGWTLSFEFFFYLVFTLSIFLNKKQPVIPVFIILLCLVLTGFLFPSITSIHFKFITNPVILEFLAGCIGGYIYLKPVKIPVAVIYAGVLAGIALMFLSVITGFGKISEMEYTWDGSLSFIRVIKWGIPSFLLVTGLVLLEKNNKLKVPGFAMVAGNISYSAYLSHIFSMMAATYVWKYSGAGMPDVFIIAAVLFSLLVAYFIYRFIEKPLTRYLNTKAASFRKKRKLIF